MASTSDYLTITREDLKKFAPKAREEYVTALLGGLYHLRTAGILDSEYRLCHFMGQVGHETDGLTIIRESLTYTSAKRLRDVWPARFRSKSDAELAPLIKNGAALGEQVYGGRMGNTHPGDGYNFRGGGFIQTTGREAVTKYCAVLGIDPVPAVLDDATVTLQFACIEWTQAKCNAYADENDLTKVSKAINTGSATGNVKPVGMQGRQEWFAKAWAIWGEQGKADKPEKMLSGGQLAVRVASPAAAVATVGTTVATTGIPGVPEMLTQSLANAQAWKSFAGQLGSLPGEFQAIGIGGLVALGVGIVAKKWSGA